MKKMMSVLRSYMGHMGVYFLLVMLFFGLVSLMMGQVSSPLSMALLWSAMLFAALVAAADFVRSVTLFASAIAKELIRGVLVIAAFAIAFVAATDVIESGKTALVGVLTFAVFEALLTTGRCIAFSVAAKHSNAAREYRNLYTPESKK